MDGDLWMVIYDSYGLMLLDPMSLRENAQRLEEIEKASLRLVVQAIFEYRADAVEIFQNEPGLAQDTQDIGEDITREALDRLGMARIEQRLYGKIDYKAEMPLV